ncbi:MAG: glutamate-5-semialdehyde dehydrogenase [Ignavibacteria bacterium]|nr:glutamate-5-semialdehyde dehydrogenase [Ignavibacteria bacterium]
MSTTLHDTLVAMAVEARKASQVLSRWSAEQRSAALTSMAEAMRQESASIIAANAKDLAEGKKTGIEKASLDRLELTRARFDAMCNGLDEIAALPDVVGGVLDTIQRPNGLSIKKVRVPIGVIGIIYESRPNVTADAASLCIKSANAVILRGGSESFHSNRAIVAAMQKGGERAGLPAAAVQLIETTDRSAVRELVQLEGLVDLVIPRGGESLIRAVSEMARVPVIKHYKGVCHTFVDATADLQNAIEICDNAKCQRPGVCNAMETLLVHQDIAPTFLPRMAERFREKGVVLHGDPASVSLVPGMKEATEEDWYTEYLDLILSVRIVPDLSEAIRHINHYGSHHSDAILTKSDANAEMFLDEVDSATVYVNASTRFTDGFEFGMGAEMGISTDKIHARGPMGLAELTTYKYVIHGTGQVRP